MNVTGIPTARKVIFSKNWDLSFKSWEYTDASTHRTGIKEKTPVYFHVERATVSTFSPFFHRLVSGYFSEASQKEIVLQDVNCSTLEVLLCVLHQQPNSEGKYCQSELTWYGLYQVMEAVDKYLLEHSQFATWFKTWYESNLVKYQDMLAKLLYPCFIFDHAEGFKYCTRELVYGSVGFIDARPPPGYDRYHLSNGELHALNAARTRVRIIFKNAVNAPMSKFLQRSKCHCRGETLFKYCQDLDTAGLDAEEDIRNRRSIRQIMSALSNQLACRERPSITGEADAASQVIRQATPGCYCKTLNDKVLLAALTKIKNYFDGLCMDCMANPALLQRRDKNTVSAMKSNASVATAHVSSEADGDEPEADSDDEHIHAHIKQHARYNSKCRIEHGEPTWHFSTLSRPIKKEAQKLPAHKRKHDSRQ